jgi:hypothetical protein
MGQAMVCNPCLTLGQHVIGFVKRFKIVAERYRFPAENQLLF